MHVCMRVHVWFTVRVWLCTCLQQQAGILTITCDHTVTPNYTDPCFLDGDVGEMHKHVVKLIHVCIVLDCAEPAKPQPIPVKKLWKKEKKLNDEWERERARGRGDRERERESEREREEKRVIKTHISVFTNPTPISHSFCLGRVLGGGPVCAILQNCATNISCMVKKKCHLHVALERTERCDQNIETQIKFLSTNQERVVNVFGNDVRLFRCGGDKPEMAKS